MDYRKQGNFMPMPDPVTLVGKNVVLTLRFEKMPMDPGQNAIQAGVVKRADAGGLLLALGTRDVYYPYVEIAKVTV